MSAEHRNDTPAHGGPKHDATAPGSQPGYETLDAQAGATYRAGLYIVGTMVVVALVLVPMYWFLARRESATQEPAATVIKEQPKAAATAFPKLVTSEPTVLAEFREQEDELLDSYGWVEKDRGIARLPIAEAVRLVGERGALPVFPTGASPLGSAPASGPQTAAPAAPAPAAGHAPATGGAR
jgi:hypothetical protein